MKLIQAIREVISANRHFFGAEFFPPHMDSGRLKLYDAMERLFHQNGPLFCSVTWGDRGSTAQETIEICDAAQRLAPVLMQAHITGAGATEQQMLEWLHELKRRDITNLFLLRGVKTPALAKRGGAAATVKPPLAATPMSSSPASSITSPAITVTAAATAASAAAVSEQTAAVLARPSAMQSSSSESGSGAGDPTPVASTAATAAAAPRKKFHLSRNQSALALASMSSCTSGAGSSKENTPLVAAAGNGAAGFGARCPDDDSSPAAPQAANRPPSGALAAFDASTPADSSSAAAAGATPSTPGSLGSPAQQPFEQAVDLVRFVRKHFGDYFGISVAAYPEGHSEGEDRATAIRHLKEKVDAGADLVICQAVFDAKVFLRFCEDCRSAGIMCPILPSVVPLHSASQLKRMANLRRLAGMDALEQRLRAEAGTALDDDEAVRAVVVDFTAQLVRQLFRAGVRGVYFMTQNVESVTRKVIAQVPELSGGGGGASALLAALVSGSNAAATSDDPYGASSPAMSSSAASGGDAPGSALGTPYDEGGGGNGIGAATTATEEKHRPLPWRPSLRVNESARPIYWSSRPSSYLAALEMGVPLFPALSSPLSIGFRGARDGGIASGGKNGGGAGAGGGSGAGGSGGGGGRGAGELQHPNGRWSNTSSPAFFGEESTYQHVAALVSASAKLCTVFMQAKTVHDVANAFVDFLHGKGSLPWSCVEGLAPESNALLDLLVSMNKRGLFTINSQPAVNAAPSADPTYGWGPRGGWCYQKQYVEFFCSAAALGTVCSVLEQCPSVVYLAQTASRSGRRSNMPCAAPWIAQGGDQTASASSSSSAAAGADGNGLAQQLLHEAETGKKCVGSFMHAAVTWGVFPSQDIQQPTFVSSSAFDLWTPEAFTMWLYPFFGNGVPVPAVIEEIVDSWYLVTALDNDFISSPTPLSLAVQRLTEVLPEL